VKVKWKEKKRYYGKIKRNGGQKNDKGNSLPFEEKQALDRY
jgi:hypothetical protein